MRKLLCALGSLVTLIAGSGSAFGAVVFFDFTSTQTTNTTLPAGSLAGSPLFGPTTFDSNVTASNIGVGVDPAGGDDTAHSLQFLGNSSIFGGPGGQGISFTEGIGLNDGTGQDIADAHAQADYIEFTVTANPGFELDLDELTFDIGRGLRGPQDYAIRTSVDSFASDLVFADQGILEVNSNGPVLSTAVNGQTIDLSGAAFQDLSSITFRIVVDDRANNNAAGGSVQFDNIAVEGIVASTAAAAVPEPSSLALLALGAIGLVTRRRR